MEKYQKYWDGEPSHWTIAESRHYLLIGCNEEAELVRKSDGKRITCVGDFYGDPTAGVIDQNERFCVTVGCGVIVYRLTEPFEEYRYNRNTAQWTEYGRDPDRIDWIESVRQIGAAEAEVADANGNTRTIIIDF